MQRKLCFLLCLCGLLCSWGACKKKEKASRRKKEKGSLESAETKKEEGPKPVFIFDPEKYSFTKPSSKVKKAAKSGLSSKKTKSAEDADDTNETESPPLKKSSKKEKEAETDADMEEAKEKPSRKSSKKSSKEAEEEAEPEAEAAPPQASFLSSSLVKILIFSLLGVLLAGGVVLGLMYFVSQAISKRTRRLRYMESLKPAHLRRGDGFDDMREVIE
ncbi:hypothetical protein NECID01_1154 [Nematocida sp. AWRm77]|nr:hypothetical protein NECID01_1154 [Nematocida sp. AWRm77]